MEIGTYEAKAKLSELIRRALDGEPVIITHRGEPIAKIVPYQNQHPAPIGHRVQVPPER